MGQWLPTLFGGLFYDTWPRTCSGAFHMVHPAARVARERNLVGCGSEGLNLT